MLDSLLCGQRPTMNWLLMPDKCTVQKEVSSLSSWLRHISQHHLFALIHTCQEVDKTEKDKGEIKVKRKNVNVGCSLAVGVMLLSSKAYLRGHPGLIHSAPLAFMSTKKCLHGVRCIPSAKETKCNCFQ